MNSFIENAFEDDSADISSDSTLFSISPSAYDINDSGDQTPLPTITSPLHDYHSSFIDNNDLKPSSFTFTDNNNINNKNLNLINGSNSEISDNSTLNNRSKKTNKNKKVAFFNLQYNHDEIEAEPIKQPTRVEEKIILNEIIPCLCAQPFHDVQKQRQPSPEKITIVTNKNPTITTTTTTITTNNNPINYNFNFNYNNYNQSSTTVDMKSQMVKYNEYLHYLRFGFPKKNKF